MFFVQRWLRQLLTMTVLRWAWAHRGTLLRTVDLVARAPRSVADGGLGVITTEARAVRALDRELPADTDLRITQVADGTVCFRPGASPRALDVARTSVLPIPTVLDVRTDGLGQPTLDDELALHRS